MFKTTNKLVKILNCCCFPSEPPTLDLDFRDKMMVKVGDPCLLSGRYCGKPAPVITWMKNEEELKSDDEISLHSTAHHLSLNIGKTKRDHSGLYIVKVENAAGTRTGTCTLTMVGEWETSSSAAWIPHRNKYNSCKQKLISDHLKSIKVRAPIS